MRILVALVVLAAACSSPSAPHAPSAPGVPPPPTSSPPTGSLTSPIERSPSERSQPTLTIVSEYPLAQFIFIDQELAGTVASGSTETIEVPAGRHTITCADSENPEDVPVHIDVMFDTGYAYTYRLHAE